MVCKSVRALCLCTCAFVNEAVSVCTCVHVCSSVCSCVRLCHRDRAILSHDIFHNVITCTSKHVANAFIFLYISLSFN